MKTDPDIYICNQCGYPTTKEFPVCQTCLWDNLPESTSIDWLVLAVWIAGGIFSIFVWIGLYFILKNLL